MNQSGGVKWLPEGIDKKPVLMLFQNADLIAAVQQGEASTDAADQAKAKNLLLEQGVSAARQSFFEADKFSIIGTTWEQYLKRHIEYVRLYVKTAIEQPHSFQDALEPNEIGEIDEGMKVVRLEGLARPMKEFGCSFEELRDAHKDRDTDFLSEFCEVWNEKRDLRPAFSTLLSEVKDELAQADWADALRDRLGLAHYSPIGGPEPVALCWYSVADVLRDAATGFPITMPTVLDSDPWEHYFPAPKSLQYGRAMALTPCVNDEDLKLEFLNSRVTYSHENIWKIGQIVTPAPTHDINTLREQHLLALQIASDDETFGT